MRKAISVIETITGSTYRGKTFEDACNFIGENKPKCEGKDVRDYMEPSEKMKDLIVELCSFTPLSINEIASLIRRKPFSVWYKYTKPLIESGKLFYTIPEMIKHPDQKYTTVKNK